MSDKQLKIIKSKDATPQTRKSPAELIMESIPEGYLSVKDMSERYGVHVQTIRRLIKARNDDGTPKVNAPTDAVQQGGLVIYLFNENDVAEMDAYMARKGYNIVAVEK
jgi:hypothetical protein